MRLLQRAAPVVVLALVVMVMLAGCQAAPQRAARGSDDWSRGVLLGEAALNARVALVAAPEGGLLAAWVANAEDGEAQRLRVATVDAQGRPGASRELPLVAERPQDVALQAATEGLAHLVWVDRRAEATRALWHTRLTGSGDVRGEERRLSPQALDVTGYALAGDGAGGLHVVWAAGEGAGATLHYLHLSPEGDVEREAPLALGGFAPALARGRDGVLHLAWLREPAFGQRQILYAAIAGDPGDVAGAIQERLLRDLPAPTGIVLRAPTVGLSTDWAYVFWSVERRGGGNAPPSAESFYVALPRGVALNAVEVQQVVIPAGREPVYTPMETSLALRSLATVPAGSQGAGFVYLAAADDRDGPELAVAYSVELAGRTESANQIVLTLWQGGAMRGYQAVTDTPAISLRPNLLVDEAGELHLTWIDTAGFGQYRVYAAGTPAPMRGYLNRVRLDDVVAAVFGALWGVAQALGFLPMVITWFVPSLLALALYALVRPEGDLERTGPRVMLVVSAVLYVAFKYLFRPSWLMSFPVPRWATPSVADALVLAAPVAIALVAAGVTLLYVRRRQYPSLFPGYMLFAGTDALLTLLIYVPAALSN